MNPIATSKMQDTPPYKAELVCDSHPGLICTYWCCCGCCASGEMWAYHRNEPRCSCTGVCSCLGEFFFSPCFSFARIHMMLQQNATPRGEKMSGWGGILTTCCVCVKTCGCIGYMEYTHAVQDIAFKRENTDVKKMEPWWENTSKITCCCCAPIYTPTAHDILDFDDTVPTRKKPNDAKGEAQPLFDLAPGSR